MKAVELTKSSMMRVVNYLIQYRTQTKVYTKKTKVRMLKQVGGVIGSFNINRRQWCGVGINLYHNRINNNSIVKRFDFYIHFVHDLNAYM